MEVLTGFSMVTSGELFQCSVHIEFPASSVLPFLKHHRSCFCHRFQVRHEWDFILLVEFLKLHRLEIFIYFPKYAE